jgi:diguanylate cyclase (GGDEF)-like protein
MVSWRARYEKLEKEFNLLKRELQRRKVELEAVQAQTEEVRYIDTLTFLPNRRKITGDLQREVQRSKRYRTDFSISLIDVDHFKRINDSYGHAAGDEVLRSLTNELRLGIRDTDEVGRVGGEEFLILLPHTPLGPAGGQAKRLCKRLRECTISVDDIQMPITISIGVAEYKIGEESSEELLKRADAALYQAKQNGRDQWRCAG